MHINGIINRPETVVSLFPGAALGKLTNGIIAAVDKSFHDEHGKMKKDISQAEIKGRFTACFDWAKILRGDMHWGVERIVGQFPEIIRCYLAKAQYTPPQRKCWIPEDGQC